MAKVKIAALQKKKKANVAPSKSSIRKQPNIPASPVTRQFACSIDDPFCTESFGAKVPDEYSLPSEALTLRHRYTVSNPVSGDYILVTPHPLLGSMALPGTSAGPPTLGAISGSASTFQVNSVATNILNISVARPTLPNNMSAVSVSYRLVGWGVRLKNITAAANVAGEVLVAVLPTSGEAPNNLLPLVTNSTVSTANPGALWQSLTKYASLPTTLYGSTNGYFGAPIVSGLDNIPSSDVFSNAEIAQTGGILIKPKLHSPGAAWRFRPSMCASTDLTLSSGDSLSVTSGTQGAAGTGTWQYTRDCLDTTGHNCVVIAPSTSSAAQTYEIEVIYHIESIPVTATGATGTPINANAFSYSPVMPRPKLDAIIHSLLKSPWVEFVKHEGSRAMGSMVQALPGLMTKAAMMALG